MGPVGTDSEGHAVVVERLGAIPAGRMGDTFSDDEWLRHAAFNREAQRALCRQLSQEQGKRLYKIAAILDVSGLNLSHLSPSFVRRLQMYIPQLSAAYPEGLTVIYVVNAPMLFSTVYGCVQPLGHHTAQGPCPCPAGASDRHTAHSAVSSGPSLTT